MARIIKLPVHLKRDAEDYARNDTERNQRLFRWAEDVLEQLGLRRAIAGARSVDDLRKIDLDVESVPVTLAIRNALHPTGKKRAEHFNGLREGSLKQIIKNRFAELKKDRERKLRRGSRAKLWSDDLVLDDKGKPLSNLANLALILSEAPDWKGVLAFNIFKAQVVVRNNPPWGYAAPDTPWTDYYEAMVRIWFQRTAKMTPGTGDVGRAVQAAARNNSFHPVRGYFDGSIWDGVPRVSTWLQNYLHVADGDFPRAIGPRFLISVVARIYEPGCKADHMLILEGPQGKKKSEALRTLAINDEWFTDRLSPLAGKDAILEIAGVLIVEIAEMDALIRASSSAAKSFLTRRFDRFRPPYGKHPVSHPRQCMFTGTINPPTGGYLKDPTGARRFWPVTCRDTIDRDGLEQVRDQLWAEAVHLYRAGHPWWLETPALEALANAEQAARFVADAWAEPIRDWLGDSRDTSVAAVIRGALGFTTADWTQTTQNRVAKILTHLGFVKYRPRTVEGREYRYHRDP